MSDLLNVYPSADALTHGAAARIASLIQETTQSRGAAMVALSGGNTPRAVYALLTSGEFHSTVPWASVHVFWGDERCVPPDHPDSNFRMTEETLLRYVPIPPAHIHRIMGELRPEQAALAYEEELRKAFRSSPHTDPQFDLLLLGLGDDGHTASLFPGTPALAEEQKLVTDVFVEKLKSNRVTLTLRAINAARHILFLVSGKGKASILAAVFQAHGETYPAQRVRPVAGDLRWLADQDAASHIDKVHHS